jgi:Na+-transporting methylmalonyl-CoA/oxaloacetate decarboxylase gamma subunit
MKKYLLFIALAMAFLFCCGQPEVDEPVQKPQKQKDLDLQAEKVKLELLKGELDSLQSELKQQELKLIEREKKLDLLDADLYAKAQRLQQKNKTLNNFRKISYTILFIGIVLLILSVWFFIRAKKLAAPEKDKKEKEEKKAESEKPKVATPRASTTPKTKSTRRKSSSRKSSQSGDENKKEEK